jgi:hypothetical protein
VVTELPVVLRIGLKEAGDARRTRALEFKRSLSWAGVSWLLVGWIGKFKDQIAANVVVGDLVYTNFPNDMGERCYDVSKLALDTIWLPVSYCVLFYVPDNAM